VLSDVQSDETLVIFGITEARCRRRFADESKRGDDANGSDMYA
jgi:hypothetical protein